MTSVLKRIRIGDIGKVVTGTTPPTQNEEYYGSDFLFIKPSDITPSIRRVFSSETKLSFAGHDFLRGKELPRNTTCVVCIGTIGKFCLTSTLSFTNQQINSVLPKPKEFDPVYVYYLLSTTIPKLQKIQGGSASGREHVNKTNFENIEVEVHPLPTQRKIASILSAYDDLIENNTRRIAILEEMAQAIYREWFVNFRFPGHENVKLVQSTLGMIPEGWEVLNLFDVSEVAYGFPYKSKQFSTDLAGKPVIRIRDIVNHKSDTYTTEDAGGRYIVRNGDILIGMDGDFHMCRWAGGEAVLNQRVARLRTKGQLPQYVLFHCVRGPISHFNATIVGTTVAHLGDKHLREINILLPPSHLRNELHSLFEPLFLEEINLRKKNELLRTTRDLLLPKLISGQLNVEELDIDLGVTAEEIGEPTAKPVERKPTVCATVEIDGASTASTSSTSEPIPIDELDVDQVMAEFRQQARRLGTTTRAELLKAVSQELGYKRLGHNIEEVLKGHLRAAIRRKIIAAEGELVCLHTTSMETYERDELVDAFHSVMRKNVSYEREDVIRALANHLGFRRITDTVREPIKSAINAAIRRGVLDYKGELIWRAD